MSLTSITIKVCTIKSNVLHFYKKNPFLIFQVPNVIGRLIICS